MRNRGTCFISTTDLQRKLKIPRQRLSSIMIQGEAVCFLYREKPLSRPQLIDVPLEEVMEALDLMPDVSIRSFSYVESINEIMIQLTSSRSVDISEAIQRT